MIRIAASVVLGALTFSQATLATAVEAPSTCSEALEGLDNDMRRVGVQPPVGMPGYGVGYGVGTTPRTELWSLYDTARSLEQRGREELCLDVVAEAGAVLQEMEQAGAVQTVTAPLLGGGCRVDTLIDLRVRNQQGEDLGHIKDLVIDLENGKIDYALLSVGGFFDIGGKLFPIPWGAFEAAADGRSFVLPVDQGALEQAPGFERDVWPDMKDPEWAKTVQDFYAEIVEQ